MGWVDRHNRFRQDILGLHRVWKTKRWQTRIQLEMIGMALVDTFLLCRKFQPQWRPNDCNTESAFWQFTRHLLPQISPAHAQPLASLDHSGGSSCCQVSIGKRTTKSSEKGNVGKKYTSQARCYYCKIAKRKERFSDGSYGPKSPRCSYTCIRCDVKMCRDNKSTCWAEHVAEASAKDRAVGQQSEDGSED